VRPPPRRNLPASPQPAPRAGFTLVELAVVIAIISIIMAIALPVARHLVISARSAALINDLRVFSSAFQTYANEHGDWPEGDGTPGAVPPGMENDLGPTNWQHATPIGGNYAWDPNSTQQGNRYRAAITIASSDAHPVILDRAQLLDLDRQLDDGNLATGNFLLGYADDPVFVLEH
jgi:prepilin-type N-terminal cleavage/methylation domain-containing protein